MQVEDMPTSIQQDTSVKNTCYEMETLKCQLDLLKQETQYINDIFSQTDQYSQTTKNWTLLAWAGSIAIALGQLDLRPYIILTVVLPIIFWFVDAYWKQLQRRTSFRAQKIHQFLNYGGLAQSFEAGKLVEFAIYDVAGRQYRHEEEYKKYISFKRALLLNEVKSFYLGLIIISIVIGMFFLLVQ